eukprot:TRINITY_DN635_c0_g1_i1.p1 TRINITY_DN635_c0_g1~~TRINITY_DN635_c0_g1_i1.p1  ORF type:complete len:641 (+),score=101.97 TRINITY_DN635_c0_g1_i1:61-1983(+)
MTSADRGTLLYLFGSNSHGQLGMRGNNSSTIPRLAKEFFDIRIRDVWCGAGETLVVSWCGRLWKTKASLGGFGEILVNKIKVSRAVSSSLYTAFSDTSGCLYVITDGSVVQKIDLPSPVVQLEAGPLFVVILLQDGTVYSMGMNLSCFQLGYETSAEHETCLDSLRVPRKITSLTHTHVLKIAVGSSHVVCLTSEGNVIGWGSNSFGELGFEDREAPVFPPKRLDVIKRGEISTISAGDRVTLLTESETGHVKVLGRPRQGSGGPPPSDPSQPHPGFGSKEAEIQTTATGGGWGNSHTVFATKDHRVFALGSNSVGQLGSGCERSQTDIPVDVELPYQQLDIKDIKLSAGWVHSAVLLTVVNTPESNALFVGANGTLAPVPLDGLELIFSFLPRRDFLKLGDLCQAFNVVSRRDQFWKERAKLMMITNSDKAPFFDQIVERKRQQAGKSVFFDAVSTNGLSSAIIGLFRKGKHRVLWVGLDAAGKTTMLYRMKLGEVVTTIPTIGFNIETVETKHMELMMWDVGGPDKIRPLWRHYFQGTDVLIFVIDSADRERLSYATEELVKFSKEDELKTAVFLIFANKQDLPGAMGVSDIERKMDLHNVLRGRHWHIHPCSAYTGDGLFEGLDWAHTLLRERNRKS